MGCVLDGHGGHDLLGNFVGNSSEKALTDGGMCGSDGVGSNARFANGKHVRRRLDVEPADQRSESRSVEVVDRRSRSGQLHCVASLGGQV
jgi:hypothetical protein